METIHVLLNYIMTIDVFSEAITPSYQTPLDPVHDNK